MESDPNAYYYLIGLFILFVISTFFSVIKIIFSSVDKDAIPLDDEKERYFASKIEEVTENRTLFSSTVALGKTISNVLFTLLFFKFLCFQFPKADLFWTIIVSAAASIGILTIFAYSISRALATVMAEKFYILAFIIFLPFRWFMLPVSLIISFVNKSILKAFKYDEKYAFLSNDEKQRLEDNDSDQSLDKEERDMIRNIFEFGDSSVKEIMLPRIDIKGIDINTDYRTTLVEISTAGHSRFPVYQETIDNIKGILYAKDVLGWISNNQECQDIEKLWNIASLLKDPVFVPGSKKLDDMMEELKRSKVHIAVVVDEYGGTEGIVTMEDILEEIVGEIKDEYDDEENEVVKISEGLYSVDPHVELDDLSEIIDYNFDLEENDYNTLGGLFYHEYGGVPKEKHLIEHKGLKLKILKMDNQRIKRIELQIISNPDNPVNIKKSF